MSQVDRVAEALQSTFADGFEGDGLLGDLLAHRMAQAAIGAMDPPRRSGCRCVDHPVTEADWDEYLARQAKP